MPRRSHFLLAIMLAACGGDDSVVSFDSGDGQDAGTGTPVSDSATQLLSVTPTELRAAGGQTITIAGVALPTDAEVFVGGSQAETIVRSPTAIVAETRPMQAGWTAIVIESSSGEFTLPDAAFVVAVELRYETETIARDPTVRAATYVDGQVVGWGSLGARAWRSVDGVWLDETPIGPAWADAAGIQRVVHRAGTEEYFLCATEGSALSYPGGVMRIPSADPCLHAAFAQLDATAGVDLLVWRGEDFVALLDAQPQGDTRREPQFFAQPPSLLGLPIEAVGSVRALADVSDGVAVATSVGVYLMLVGGTEPVLLDPNPASAVAEVETVDPVSSAIYVGRPGLDALYIRTDEGYQEAPSALPVERLDATSVAALDLDLDGATDLVVGTVDGVDRMWRNRGDAAFEDYTPALGVDIGTTVGLAVAARDGEQQLLRLSDDGTVRISALAGEAEEPIDEAEPGEGSGESGEGSGEPGEGSGEPGEGSGQ